jgi:oligopeptidase B
VGAALNLAPERFCAAVGAVPFLDAAGTLQDASLPLTVNEWEEFGNPNEAGGHESVLGFSPVHNVRPRAAYPPMLLLPALNDARTGFWEALKYAHAVRTNGRGDSEEEAGEPAPHPGGLATAATGAVNTALVRMDMEGGHFRSADPAERARQRAKELGFLVAAARAAAADNKKGLG